MYFSNRVELLKREVLLHALVNFNKIDEYSFAESGYTLIYIVMVCC